MANSTQYRGLKGKYANTPKGIRIWLQKAMAKAEILKREEPVKTKVVPK